MTKCHFLLLIKKHHKRKHIFCCCYCFAVGLSWFQCSQCHSLPGTRIAEDLFPEMLCNGRDHQVVMSHFFFTTVYLMIVNIIMALLCSHDNASIGCCALLYIVNHFSNKENFAIGNINEKIQEDTHHSCS